MLICIYRVEESNVCRFSIDAPVSTMPAADDDLITYLNKGIWIWTWRCLWTCCTAQLNDLDLDLDSARIHWATLRRHSDFDLFWAATSASSQVIPILNKSLWTVFLQLVRGRHGPLLNPGNSQCNACRDMGWWSIRITFPSQWSLLSPSMSSILCCPVMALASSFVTLSFQEMPKMLQLDGPLKTRPYWIQRH